LTFPRLRITVNFRAKELLKKYDTGDGVHLNRLSFGLITPQKYNPLTGVVLVAAIRGKDFSKGENWRSFFYA